MNPDIRNVILWVGIAWGIIFLPVGFFVGFTIAANDTIATLVWFSLIFILPIIASVAARWIPMVSGYVLLGSVIVVLIGFYVTGGMPDVLAVLSRVYIWPHILFGITFVVLAKRSAQR